jgi:hypothetical protein
MIHIKPSPTADSRTCDFKNVTKDQLFDSSTQHIDDVGQALEFFVEELAISAHKHDRDKLTDIDGFHACFVTGFERRDWLDRHYKINRHHLNDEVPEDVTLIDVLDMIADIVMAGMARSGEVYPLEISAGVLQEAMRNTIEMLKREIVVEVEA